MSDNWWALVWVLCGIPFAIVCTARIRREEGTWVGLIPGVCIGAMFGPASLLMITKEPE